MRKRNPIRNWLIALMVLNLLDMITTLIGVIGFGGTELNPAMAFLLRISPWAFVGIKLAFVGLLGLYMSKSDLVHSKFNTRVIKVMVAFFTLIVINNSIGCLLCFWFRYR